METPKPTFLITKNFTFAASHQLPGYPGKCAHLHGHTWKLEVTLQAPSAADGISIDFSSLKKTVQERVINLLDHTHLNDLLDHPTAENLSRMIFQTLRSVYHEKLFSISLWESPTSCITLHKHAYKEDSDEHSAS